MIHIQKEEKYDQYWFRIKTKPFNLYPDSEGCNRGKAKLMNERMVGIAVPKGLDMSKKHKYILNLDFNIDGKASDWFCNEKFYNGWGGVISNAPGFTDNEDCLMKNYMIFLNKLLDNGYILVHTSLTSEDVYYNQPCEDTEPCQKCWFPNNPDKDYLQNLFNMIYKNSYPGELKNLKLDYNQLSLLGYSVGAGAVSRYINEFPFLKTTPGNYPFPIIRVGIMIAGGSLWCYSKDCKGDPQCRDKKGKPDPNFAPCFDPDMKIRGCCPHNLSEPNFDDGKIPWSEHPPMVLAQSTDDNFADPMATTFYTSVMKAHDVPVLNTMEDSTDHGIASLDQIDDIINWVNKYSSVKNNPKKENDNYKIFIAFVVIFSILLGISLLSILFGKIKQKSGLVSIAVTLILLALTIGLYFGLNKKPEDSSTPSPSDNEIINALEKLPKATKVTVGELFDKVVDIKDKIYSDHPDIGGVLVHLLAVEDMNTIVNTKPFVFNLASPGTDDCAQTTPKPGQNGPTCSAWTYLRKDLPPVVFSYPSSNAGGMGFWPPSVGIIVNPSIIWPLITTMGIVDSATNGRNCGAQDPNWDFNIFDAKNNWGRCNPTVFDKNGQKSSKQGEFCIYQSLCKRQACPISCTYDKDDINTNCRMRNSGGGVHNVAWFENNPGVYSWDCPKENTTNTDNSQTWPIDAFPNGAPSCYKAQEIEWKDICPADKEALNSNGYGNKKGCEKWAVFNPDFKCYLNNPHIYKTTDTPPLGTTPVSGKLIQNDWWRTNFSASNIDRNYTYIGDTRDKNKGGATFSEQTWKNCELGKNAGPDSTCYITEGSTIPRSSENIMRIQAKFIKEDWGRWLEELTLMWKEIYGTLDKNKGYKNRNAALDGNGDTDYNWIYGNACNTNDWWENEVNIYINPEMANDDNSNLNKLYRDGVMGFLYIGKTCEDFMKDLPTGTDAGSGCAFKNAEERCKGYLCNFDVDAKECIYKVNGKKVTYNQVKNMERKRMAEGKSLVQSLVKLFNSKYRSGKDDPQVKGYKLMSASNAIQSWPALNKVFTGTLKGSEVFVPIN